MAVLAMVIIFWTMEMVQIPHHLQMDHVFRDMIESEKDGLLKRL